MLRDLDLKSVYDSDEDNLFEDFYVPALSTANLYQRSVGYFSAVTITHAAQALSCFFENGGKVQLIVGAFVDENDYEAIVDGYQKKEIVEKLADQFVNVLSDIDSDLAGCRLKILSRLVATGAISVKVALRPNGLFHEKVGIISDSSGDKLVFSGSANETDKALLPGYNFESINVFSTWKPEFESHFQPHISKFDRLWKNESPNTAVIDFPDAAREKLVQISQQFDTPPSLENERELWEKFRGKVKSEPTGNKPKMPEKINGSEFNVREHQTTALRRWRANDFLGILALATGAGKTVTAIYGITQIASQIDNLVVIIAVPYQDLADQWCEVLSLFNIFPIRCYRSKAIWQERLASASHYCQSGAASFTAIVVVNRTLKSAEFQTQLAKFNPEKMFLIGDECHHHGSLSYEGFLPTRARFRLGLSATPEHYLDDKRNEHLESIYGKVVDTYSLKQAVKDKILTPYRYTVIPIELTPDEGERFTALSVQIGRMFAAQQRNSTTVDDDQPLQAKLRERSRIVASARNKLPALQKILSAQTVPIQHSLFYCGDGTIDLESEDAEDAEDTFGVRQIELVGKILHDHGWSSSRFTSRENKTQRKEILDNFKNSYIDSLVAIKCLDEGIDIPACSTAFILASSRDPRQFIQRRGRILRRSEGKEFAQIFDFLVLLPEDDGDGTEYSRRLLVGELERVAEFASLSQNRHECYETLRPILTKYSLEHLV